MNTYQYQLVKYVHDQFTGEFLNVGVILYSPEAHFLDCRVTSRAHRISHCFPDADGRFVTKVLRHLETSVRGTAKQLNEFFKPSVQLEQITASLLPPDNSALQLSPVMQGIDIDMDAALNGLYKSLVEKYEAHPGKKPSLSDEDVWRLKYKKYFDNYKISRQLTSHRVKTKTDTFVFDKAWKNGIWHCFEPISFALASEEAIKEKVYKWAGRLQGIKQADEKISLTLLASISQEHKGLQRFIRNYLQTGSEHVEVSLVMDADAEATAKKIKQLIEEHSHN
ncbi:DUF3037 domain-containing protein [Pseudocnuella soli]|uniref:DUF3037 domain-containing protein n=1 Tax=Pseudocnuella soli TaxID=2502779 RepID=UPI00104FBC2B|nr:DUF3037 domain-containing protein [Pseudocnuella soli]